MQSRRKPILLVEANRGLRHALTLYLELEEHEVHTAGSLAELDRVLDALDRPPSVVISDLHLGPHDQGSDAIDRVRRHFRHRLPAILLSESLLAATSDASDTGIKLLCKPVDPQQLTAAIDELLAPPPQPPCGWKSGSASRWMR